MLRRTPSTSPIDAVYMRASPRAVPMPLEAGSSAACTSDKLKSISAGSVAANALLLNAFGSSMTATSSRSSSGIDYVGAVVRSTSGCWYIIRLDLMAILENGSGRIAGCCW